MAYPSKPQRNKELVKKIDSGWSFRQVGEYFNLSASTAHEVYHKWSSVYSKKRSELSPEKDLTTVRA